MVKRKLLSVAVIIIGIVVFVTGCVPFASEKTYEKDDFSIKMESGFFEKDLISVTYYYESKTSILTALKEDFSTLEAAGVTKDSTNEDYLNCIIAVNKFEDSGVKTDKKNNIKYIEYDKTISGRDFYYVAVAVKGEDAFWLCNFACEKDQQSKFKDKFLKWAKTIEVK